MTAAVPDVSLAALAMFLLFVVGNAVQTMIGFGSSVVPLTLGALFFPLADIQVLVVPLNLLTAAIVVLREHARVDRRLLFVTLVPWMCAGGAVGLVAAQALPGRVVLLGFGAVVAAVAIRELWALARGHAVPAVAHHRWWQRVFLFLAGIVQGAYVAGGPLVVVALLARTDDRRTFRATLIALWLVLNSLLLVVHALSPAAPPFQPWALLAFAPSIPLGIALGELLHRRVPERGFKVALFCLLLVAGLALIARARAPLPPPAAQEYAAP